jgi:hypothetical protein
MAGISSTEKKTYQTHKTSRNYSAIRMQYLTILQKVKYAKETSVNIVRQLRHVTIFVAERNRNRTFKCNHQCKT